jgi:hypothetical protein
MACCKCCKGSARPTPLTPLTRYGVWLVVHTIVAIVLGGGGAALWTAITDIPLDLHAADVNHVMKRFYCVMGVYMFVPKRNCVQDCVMAIAASACALVLLSAPNVPHDRVLLVHLAWLHTIQWWVMVCAVVRASHSSAHDHTITTEEGQQPQAVAPPAAPQVVSGISPESVANLLRQALTLSPDKGCSITAARPAGAGSTTDDCTICKERYKGRDYTIGLHCRHVYHLLCLLPWLLKTNTCPTCRAVAVDVADAADVVEVREETRAPVIDATGDVVLPERSVGAVG